jgi:U3 small nucleolar RNA-associated protein 4
VVFHGQHWIENPRGHLLPKLESAPLIFTFRPQPRSISATNRHLNGDAHRESQHLFIVTAKHQIHEFDVLAGHSSSWGRRNHASMLPAEFRKQRDRVMGALWDVTRDRQRLWLYGNSWMVMLNVAGDLAGPASATKPEPQQQQLLSPSKRRSSGREDGDRSITITADFESTPSKRRRVDGPSRQPAYREGLAGTAKRYEKSGVTTFELDANKPAAVKNQVLEDEEDEAAGAFVRATQSRKAQKSHAGHDEDDDGEDEDVNDNDRDEQHINGDGPKSNEALVRSEESFVSECRFWLTTKYRSILGVVPLSDLEVEAENGAVVPAGVDGEEDVLEVVVVERPLETIS